MSDKYSPLFCFKDRQLMLDGTLPVPFKGQYYNIPVRILIPPYYPGESPVCLVNPTPQMVIQPSQHIDQTGRFYHPYLGYWDPQKNTLVETLQLMRSIFAQQPPVYSKPISTATTAVSASPGSSSSTPASPPTAAYSSLGRASTTGAIRPAPGFLPMPQTTFLVPPDRRPISGSDLNAQTQQSDAGFELPAYSALPPLSHSSSHSRLSAPETHRPLPALPQQSSGATSGTPPVRHQKNNDSLTELELKTSLLSALEDKIRRFYFSKDQEEMDRQLYLNKVLMDGESTIRAGLRRLEDEKLVVGRSIDALCRSAEELRQMIAVQSATVEPGVDELVSPTDVIYKQLMECMAEDDAIEDTIYYVGKALAAGRVDLPSFMKCIRQLARDQFMRRALCFKIKRQLGI